jgi:hypothetical protein
VEAAQQRNHERYPVHWKAVIIYKKNGKEATFHGRTYDLSLGGASIYADENIYVDDPVVMTIKVRTKLNSSRVIGVKCQMLYTILSSNYGKFRIGIQFLEFNADGEDTLTEALSKLVPIKDNKAREKEFKEDEIRAKKLKERELKEQAIKEKEIRNKLEKEIRYQIENEIKEKNLKENAIVNNEVGTKSEPNPIENKESKKISGRLNHG